MALDKSVKNVNLFEIEVCNNVKVFTITLKKHLTDSKFLNLVYMYAGNDIVIK